MNQFIEEFKWEQKYSVGVKKIDNQHKELFRMLNKLIKNRNANVNSAEISETLNEMMDYALYHFKTEEDLFTKYDYKNKVEHQESHSSFIEKTIEFCEKAVEQDQRLPEELLLFLTDWFTNHFLLDNDPKCIAFYKENGIT